MAALKVPTEIDNSMRSKLHNLIINKTFATVSATIVFVSIMALGEFFIQTQKLERENERRIDAVSYAATLRARLEREINTLLYLTSGLGSYLIVRYDKIEESELYNILAVLHQNSKHVRNFGVALGYRLSYVYPVAGNEAAIGLNYREEPLQWPVIEEIIANRTPALAGPIDLVQGGRGLIYRVPIFIDGQYWGLLSTVIDWDSLYRASFEESINNKYEFSIRGKNGLGLDGDLILDNPAPFNDENAVIQEFDIPGGKWAIAVRPLESNLNVYLYSIHLATFIIGSLFAWMLYSLLRSQSKMAYFAMFDSLTKLPNRRLLSDRAKISFARQVRNEEKVCALLFIDLDGFKGINDEHGHKAGDAVLVQTANRAESLVRKNDTVARLGGDEFVVLIENFDRSKTDKIVERFHKLLETPIEFEGKELTVGASIGLAFYPDSGVNLETILKKADREMYLDKTARKSA